MTYWIFTLLLRSSVYATATKRRQIRFALVCSATFITFTLGLSLSAHNEALSPTSHQKLSSRPLLPTTTEASAEVHWQPGEQLLRLLVLGSAQDKVGSSDMAMELIEGFARQHGFKLARINVATESDLRSYLLDDKGDIVLSAKNTLVADPDTALHLSLPWGVSQQQVISRSDTGLIRQTEDLLTRQLALKRSSPSWPELTSLASMHPSMDIVLIPEATSADVVLKRVASGQYDVTVLDNLAVEKRLPAYLNLDVAFNLSQPQTLSWGVAATAPTLLSSLNDYIKTQYLQANIARSYQEDLPELQAKRTLRLITYQSPINYYLEKGRLKGFEHDLIKRFAEANRMRLDVVIADDYKEMQALLTQGKGDVIAAAVPRQSINAVSGVSFSRAYSHAAPTIVGRSIDSPIMDVRGLSGRQIVVPATSPYVDILRDIQQRGIKLEVVVANAEENMDDILFKVANGVYDLSLANSQEMKAHLNRQLNIRAHIALTEPLPHVWAVRESDTQLLSALNTFIHKEFRKAFYNVLHAKYIDQPRNRSSGSELLASIDNLSPYDEIVHKYAEFYGFDWRLIVAQMYQESQFDPLAVSYAGAEGLMQIIPDTAELLGLADVNDPVSSIQAGVRYLDYLRGKFEAELSMEDRIWFSLASYNAGYNRISRARNLAESMGLNRNKWFDNVEKAMLVLAKPSGNEGMPTPYCRCGQTVVYVRDIRTLYNNYVRLTQSVKTASNLAALSKDI